MGVVRELEPGGAVFVRGRSERLEPRCGGVGRFPREAASVDVEACSAGRDGVDAGCLDSVSSLRLICTRPPLGLPLLDIPFPKLAGPELETGDNRDVGGGPDAFCSIGCSKREESMVG